MSRSNILFIINPISGGKDKLKIPDLIDQRVDRSRFVPNYSFTEYAGHASVIAEEAANKNFDVIVAVGGDGTINEVASKVMQYEKVLGIIPLGSGNGLARFLNIPLRPADALGVINGFKTTKIDSGAFNGKSFFNMAGMGFDAYISSVFAGDKSRGLKGYLQHGLKEVLGYKAQTYRITIDGTLYIYKAYVVSIANSSQYGNNAHISPLASVADGLLDVCIVKEFPMIKLPVLAYEMIAARTDRSDLVEIIRGKDILIERVADGPIHIDGEPLFMGKELKISVSPLSLNIITP
ncbi:MAG: diacylglycerol kinase family lipid kinase [Pedobacter sp.]|nr:MAG: diacylglycerol kinase family lipid kinase [Pedobacter sp.]